jgi:hypothetical protein
MAKEKITRAEYLQLLGPGLIAKRHYAGIVEARDAMHSILRTSEDGVHVGSGNPDGWVSNVIWSVDYMLKNMNVAVEPEAVNADS